jgi:hypothetical protein
MPQTSAFPLSPRDTKHTIILLVVYGILVIASALAYILLSGDQRLPTHFILLLIVTGVSIWGIWSRYRWAWAVAAIFSAWQIYSGVTNMIALLNAGVTNAPAPAKIVFGFVALRTCIVLVLFVLLLFFSDREKMHS